MVKSGLSKEININSVRTCQRSHQEFGRFLLLSPVQGEFALCQKLSFVNSIIELTSRTQKVLIKIGSPTTLNPWVAVITVAFVSCLVSATATVGQAAIIHRSLNFTYTPVGTIIFCLYVINGLSLLGILGVSIGCMVISARLICSRKDSVHNQFTDMGRSIGIN